MSEERETPVAGAPVEESEATHTQVQEAVERASEHSAVAPVSTEPASAQTVSDPSDQTIERPVIAPVTEPPSAGAGPTAAEIFAASTGSTRQVAEPAPLATEVAAPVNAEPTVSERSELAQRLEADAAAANADQGLGPARDGEIRISADHPMAALYMQTPMPPELKGNRGAGVLIALVATIGFAVVYAGVLALWLAPTTSPSRFVSTLLETALWPVSAASIGFFIALALLVVIVGRAGWWAYVLGGILVAAIVWASAIGGMVYGTVLLDGTTGLNELINDGVRGRITPLGIIDHFGLVLPVIAAAVVAREVTVWFGAWIGARGRRVTRKNAAALAEYEAALADVQANRV